MTCCHYTVQIYIYIAEYECECVWITAMSATLNDNQAKIVWNPYTWRMNTKKNSLKFQNPDGIRSFAQFIR